MCIYTYTHYVYTMCIYIYIYTYVRISLYTVHNKTHTWKHTELQSPLLVVLVVGVAASDSFCTSCGTCSSGCCGWWLFTTLHHAKTYRGETLCCYPRQLSLNFQRMLSSNPVVYLVPVIKGLSLRSQNKRTVNWQFDLIQFDTIWSLTSDDISWHPRPHARILALAQPEEQIHSKVVVPSAARWNARGGWDFVAQNTRCTNRSLGTPSTWSDLAVGPAFCRSRHSTPRAQVEMGVRVLAQSWSCVQGAAGRVFCSNFRTSQSPGNRCTCSACGTWQLKPATSKLRNTSERHGNW